MKKLLIVLAMLSLVTVLTVACGSSGGAGSNSATAVHMGNTTFTQPSVTISKGSSIALTNDMAVTHIISNGSWVNGSAMPATEPSAPVISGLQFTTAGQSHTIGPFNTAGTYHFYCSVHQNMNLDVTVQ